MKQKFEGATGSFSMDSSTTTRSTEKATYLISNIVDGSNLGGEPNKFYNSATEKWDRIEGSDDFIYSTSRTDIPEELPYIKPNDHQVKPVTRGITLTLSAFSIIISLSCIVVTILFRAHKIIKASQPPFLHLISIGTLILSSSIIPLLIDNNVAKEESATIACNASIWLISIGFTITFSALFSKTWRIIKVISSAKKMSRVTIEPKDVMIPFLVLMSCNLIILITQVAKEAHFEWDRTVVEENKFDQIIETKGKCDYSGKGFWYLICLTIVNAIALIAANVAAYYARDISNAYSESRYIAIAMISIFQAIFFGGPILIIVYGLDNQTVFIIVLSSMIFIVSTIVQLFIFGPKMYEMYNPTKKTGNRGAVISGLTATLPTEGT